MANVSVKSSSVASGTETNQTYGGALAMVTTLFFMWGFLTCLNDILVPHLKAIFDLNYAQVMLIQFAFFSAYFLFSLPSGKVIEYFGYKRTMVTGSVPDGCRRSAFYSGSQRSVVSRCSLERSWCWRAA